MSSVIDPLYSPYNSDESALFNKKQSFMYAVFVKTILTDNGKKYVRDYENDYDAQSMYEKLLNHAKSSTFTSIESSNILSYITSAKLGKGKWCGTSESFILNWQEQVRLYESMVEGDDCFSNGQKRSMLQNSGHSLKLLRAVKDMADQFKVRTGTHLSYEEYSNLLIPAAFNHNATFESKYQPKNHSNRNVYEYVTDTNPPDYSSEDIQDELSFNIDSSVADIQAYSTRQQNPSRHNHPSGSRMPRNSWDQLSNDAKVQWDRLTDKDKKIILTSFNPADSTKRTSRNVYLHDLSAYDFIRANLYELRLGSDGDVNLPTVSLPPPADDTTPVSNNPEHNNDDRTLLTYETKHNNVSPGDICKVLS